MSSIEKALARANQIRRSIEAESKVSGTLSPERQVSTSRKSRWWYCAGILLALSLGIAIDRYLADFFIPERTKPLATQVAAKPVPVAKQAAPLNPTPVKKRLPSAIPLNTPDPAHSPAHPGWQCYKTEAMEFRVFRKENTVRAIQVITRSKNAIADNFFTSFLGEIADRDSYKVQSGDKKNGFYVEKGSVGSTAEVLVYRKRPAGEIRAFVVAYR